MWQLNFAHWDLFHQLQEGNSPFKLDYSFYRLFEDKHDPSDIEEQQLTIDAMHENNVDHLLIDAEWFKHQVDIFDYLGTKNSDVLIETASLYGKRYNGVVTAYEDIRNKYYIQAPWI